MTAREVIADQAARETARTVFDRPLVLEAGAGTGKTAALVARVLTWALETGWERAAASTDGPGQEDDQIASRVLQRIVAITFTEKAAGEMAERVATALRQVIAGDPVTGFEVETLCAGAEERTRRARALLLALHHLPTCTIHAFCRRVLARHALAAGVHPGFDVDADQRGVSATLSEVLAERLPVAFGTPGDADFLRLAASAIGAGELRDALLVLLQAGVTTADLEGDATSPERCEALMQRLEQRLEPLAGILAAAFLGPGAGRPGVPARIADMLEGVLAAARKRELPGVIAAAQAFTKSDETRIRDWRKGKFNNGETAALGDMRAEVQAACTSLTDLINHTGSIDPEHTRTAQAVLRDLLARVRGRMTARGLLTFDDLLRLTHDLLHRRRDVAQALAEDMDLLLVDEFQDTDPRQYAIVACLTLDVPPESRPALFLVGDPKQSIYGWRQADLGAYEDFLQRVLLAGGERLRLNVNFRSVPAVLDEVRRCLEPVMEEQPGLQPAFEVLEVSPDKAQQPGYREAGRRPVEFWFSDPLPAPPGAPDEKVTVGMRRNVEAHALARDLVALRDSGAKLGEVGVLFRTVSNQTLYLDALRAAGVPYVVESDRTWYRRREIVDAACLLRAVIDPDDVLALVGFLRSPLVGVPDAAWIPLWKHGLPRLAAAIAPGGQPGGGNLENELDELIAAAAAELSGDLPGSNRHPDWPRTLRHALQVLSVLRHSLAHERADVFSDRLAALLLPVETEAARYQGAHRACLLEGFLDEALGILTAPEGGASRLLEHLRTGLQARDSSDGPPGSTTENAVRVLTIHKAKGLGFDHVYCMDLDAGSGARGGSSRNLVSRLSGQLEFALLGARTPGCDEVTRRQEAVERAERVRLLYVATTRARQRLVLGGSFKPPKSDCETLSQLVSLRSAGIMTRDDLRAGSGGQQPPQCEDGDGVLWRLPARSGDEQEGAADQVLPAAPPAAEAREDAAQIEAARAEAAVRAARPRIGTPSGSVTRVAASLDDADGEDARVADAHAEGTVARAVGTAVHAFLEDIDLEQLQEAGAPREPDWPALLTPLLPPAALRDGAEAAEALWKRVREGALLQRLARIAPGVLGREVPFVMRSRGDAAQDPVDCTVGAIDLLYRDPGDQQLVVADYKTDRVDGRQPEALLEHYAPQGRAYVAAVQAAFPDEPPPRFELWLLAADSVVRAP